MAKTVDEIRDGLVGEDKQHAELLEKAIVLAESGKTGSAALLWTCLPAEFRARYDGIDAEGNLIPKVDAVMAQVLSVLHPADREHAGVLTKITELRRSNAISSHEQATDLWLALPADLRWRYVRSGDTWSRFGERGPDWATFLANHGTSENLTPSFAGDVGSVRVTDGGAVAFATSSEETPDDQLAALKAQLAYLQAQPDTATQMQNARAVLSAAGTNTTPKETTTMTTNEKKTGPSLGTMATNAAWQAGVIVATTEVRNFLVTLLTMDLPEDRRESGRALAAEMLSGRFGTPLVSAALGVGLFGAEQAGIALPMLSPAVQTRLCEETSTMALREGMVIAYTAGRDLVATHGKGLLEALGNLNAIAERTHVRIDDGETREPAEVPAVNGHARTAQA